MGVIYNPGNLVPTGPSDSRPSTRMTGVKPSEDRAQLATVSLAAQAAQINRTDPPRFQAILSDAMRKLKVACLSGMADRSQQLAEASDAGTLSGSAGNT